MLRRLTRLIMPCVLILAAGPALAGGSSAPFTPQPPDPALRNATPYMISLKAFDQCLIVQSQLNGTTREAVHSPCSCYAKRTVAKMTKAELDFFRGNGYFDDTAREKALESLDVCKLKRPF